MTETERSEGYFGQFKGYIFAVLGHFCFLLRLGDCGSQGLYNCSKPKIRIFVFVCRFFSYFLAFGAFLFCSLRVRGGEPEGVRKHLLSKKVFLFC